MGSRHTYGIGVRILFTDVLQRYVHMLTVEVMKEVLWLALKWDETGETDACRAPHHEIDISTASSKVQNSAKRGEGVVE